MDGFKENQIKKLKRQAKNLGLQIVEMQLLKRQKRTIIMEWNLVQLQ